MYTRSLEIRHKGNQIERLTKAPLFNHQEHNQSTKSNMDSDAPSKDFLLKARESIRKNL